MAFEATSPADPIAHDIEEALINLASVIDSLDLKRLGDCFSFDAKMVMLKSSIGISRYRHLLEAAHEVLTETKHSLGIPVLQAIDESEPRRVSSRCYFTAMHRRKLGKTSSTLLIGGWYRDDWRLIGGVWRLAQRQGVGRWFAGDREVLGGIVAPGAIDWSLADECPLDTRIGLLSKPSLSGPA